MVKLMINFLHIIKVVPLLLLLGCDGEERIAGDYFYSDSGWVHTSIIKRNKNKLDDIVISSRVDKFIFYNGKIYVARRPVLHIEEEGVMKVKLSNECEFYVIDVSTNKVSVSKSSSMTEKFKELRCSIDK